jgi:hypothetical protein
MPVAPAKAKAFIAQSDTGRSEIEAEAERSRELMAGARPILQHRPGDAGTPGPVPQRKQKRRPKQNKLVYKNRWLISINIVAALRRAGVICDIVTPPKLDGGATASKRPQLDQATSSPGPEDVARPARRLH